MNLALFQTALTSDSCRVRRLKPDTHKILVPDLHNREDMLGRALDFQVDGYSVEQHLSRGSAELVPLGDYTHSERPDFWSQVDSAWNSENPEPCLELMDAEMSQSLRMMESVLRLAEAYPSQVHLIRGNHDDCKPEKPYGKLAPTQMVSRLAEQWLHNRCRPEVVEALAGVESRLPLIAAGDGLIVTHTVPCRDLSLAELESGACFHEVTRVDNRKNGWGEKPEHLERLQRVADQLGQPDFTWFIGHKPAADGTTHRSQFGGKLIQVGHPVEQYLVAIPAGARFDPDAHIHRLA